MNVYVVMNVSNNFNNIILIDVEFYNRKTLLLLVLGFGFGLFLFIFLFIVNVILCNVEIVI